MSVADYDHFYQVNQLTGEITYSYRPSSDPPFSILNMPTGDGDTILIQFGTQTQGFEFAGTDDRNNVFFDRGFFYFTNDAYNVGDIIPNYPADLASRDTGPYVACFLSDTVISTPDGQILVQDLVIGDRVLTAYGRSVPVKWIGRQSVMTLFAQAESRAPICIKAEALGPNIPARDLKLTADHALLIDGVLVQAGALVNGVTIRRMSPVETGPVYTVFHIETEGHQIILAEGCPAETFVDTVSRRRFDNYAEYQALFGDDAETIRELDLPRVKSARQLPPGLRDLTVIRRAVA
jgi:hypothetical protein